MGGGIDKGMTGWLNAVMWRDGQRDGRWLEGGMGEKVDGWMGGQLDVEIVGGIEGGMGCN